jgi:NADPH:quinone reductase-like Zn-dependent oxidoreductase
MRAVVITRFGGPEVLEVQEREDPRPDAGEVRIEVSASGITFSDVLARVGLYSASPKPPFVVGYEVAGTIAELGKGVDGFKVGQRVMASTEFGGYASQAVAAASSVVALPDQVSFEQGASIPVNYSTAWVALIAYCNLQGGERVLIHAAAGGVGIAATQIAKRHGAEVYGTASPSKHERIVELGVDHPLDYTREGWETGLPKFDVILDSIGGKSFRRSYSMLRPGGRLVAFGTSSIMSGEKRNRLAALRAAARTPRFSVAKQMSESKSVIGLNLRTIGTDRGTTAPAWIDALTKLFIDGTIKPVVAEVFPFERAGDAHRMISERRNIGKVLLTP